MRRLLFAAVVALAFATTSSAFAGAHAQKIEWRAGHCAHGLRCGHACLPRGKVCRNRAEIVTPGFRRTPQY